MADYALEPRPLDEADSDWVDRFACGEEWWSREVTDFLRHAALEHGKQGFNGTTLFSFPGYREIVGFLTVAGATLQTATVAEILQLPLGVPQRIPAILIPYMGVARGYRGVGHFGQEMHTQLLDSLRGQWAATRVVYLECWEDNEDGIRFWEKRGYTTFHRFQADKPDGTGKAWLRRMLLDRFALAA